MKILNADQIRKADQYTIENTPISSIDLMEKAAAKCAHWLIDKYDRKHSFQIFCGTGNNGGDGYAIARHLFENGYQLVCYAVNFSENISADTIINRDHLEEVGIKIVDLHPGDNTPEILGKKNVVIDAIFGSGLTREIRGFPENIIQEINHASCNKIAIDIPSGLYCDDNSSNPSDVIIHANHTLTFQQPKLSLLLPENGQYVGMFHVLPIGLNKSFIKELESPYYFVTMSMVRHLLRKRGRFSHKGTFGHAQMIGGSLGKIGAISLATRACLRSGVGLVSTTVPKCGYDILQTYVPEAMTENNAGQDKLIGTATDHNRVIGIGPGMGTDEETTLFLRSVIESTNNKLVIDADALNILSQNKEWLSSIPKDSILTPHPLEFERLIGKSSNNKERLQMLSDFSINHQMCIVLKGANTAIACPDGKIFFNSTGNAGMATGGSGDVLAGMITGLLAQGYSSEDSCLIGVFLHGLAGDLTAKKWGENAMLAGDIIKKIGKAFLKVERK